MGRDRVLVCATLEVGREMVEAAGGFEIRPYSDVDPKRTLNSLSTLVDDRGLHDYRARNRRGRVILFTRLNTAM